MHVLDLLAHSELVDDVDSGRWCTADDVWSESPRAVDLAGDPTRLATLRDEVLALTGTIAPHVPGFGDLALVVQVGQAEAFQTRDVIRQLL